MSKHRTALEIYRKAYQFPADIYVDNLRKAVYLDMQEGSCQMIEELVMNPLKTSNLGYYSEFKIPMLPYHAINQALILLENGGDFPDLGVGIKANHNEFYAWDYFNRRGLNLPSYAVTNEQLQQLGRRYTQLCSDFRMSGSRDAGYYGLSGFDKNSVRKLEKVRKEADEITAKAEREANAIIQRANDTAESIKEDARNRSASTQTNANTYAERIRRDADNEAKKTRRDAENEAKKIRQDAKDEAEQIRRKATEYLESVKRSAEDDAEGIRAAARQQMEEEAERTTAMLIQQKLSAHIQELRRQWEEEQREKAAQRAETSTIAAALKEEACTRSTSIGASLNQGLNQLQEQLNQLRSNMTLDLQKWRTSLYKCEYGKLVNFYNTLNGYANSFERELREAECGDTASDELKTVLGEHSRKLNRLRSNLTGAMETMGLRLFTPQKGDLFNSYYHTTNSEEDDDVFLDREIKHCLKPGIERVVNDLEVAVLLRASVEVQMD